MSFCFSSLLLSLSVSLFCSVSVELVENQDPGTNADLTVSQDSAELDLAEPESTVNGSHPTEGQEVVSIHAEMIL